MTAKRRKIDCQQVHELVVEVWDVTLQMQWHNTGYELIDEKSRAVLGYVYANAKGFRTSTNTQHATLGEAVDMQATRAAHTSGWKGMI